MSEAAAKPGGSRLPQPRGIPRPNQGIPRSRPLASTTSSLASGRVTRQSLSAPDLSKIGLPSKPAQRAPTGPNALLRKAVTTASSKLTAKVAQPTNVPATRKRPAPTSAAPGPIRKKPLVESNNTDKRPPASSTTQPKRGKPAPWDIKAKLEHANERIAKLTEENEYLNTAAAQAVTTQQELERTSKEIESLNLQLQDSNSKLESVSKSEKELRVEAQNTKQELEKFKQSCESLNAQLSEWRQKYDDVHESEQQLREKLKTVSDELSSVSAAKSNLTKELAECQETSKQLDEKRLQQIFNEQQIKRSLLNQILDLKGNIRVFCRVRPPLPHEEGKNLLPFNFPNEASVELKITEKGNKSQPDKKNSFTYDQVFGPNSTQQDIYDELSALVQSALDGHNVCVFAYGQTGSGKTFTMEGGSGEAEGMIPRSIKTIFHTIKEQNKLGWEFTVRCSFIEIYNENIRDLLNPNSNMPHEVKMMNNSEDVCVSNLKVEVVTSEEMLLKYLAKAQKSRFVAATVMNDTSSRSHSITQIKLEGTNESRNIKCQGTLNLIDLAGSEKYRFENQADRKVETVNINRSLTTLSLVVLRLAEKADHIPFRDSKLTHILMPSLKGNSKTLMMVNISPFEDCQNETISSLRFASRVSSVKVDSKRQIKSSINPSANGKQVK